MDFLSDLYETYSRLPGVFVTHYHSDCFAIEVNDEKITVSVWPYGNTPLYRVHTEDLRGIQTVNTDDAKTYIRILYLDMIKDKG